MTPGENRLTAPARGSVQQRHAAGFIPHTHIAALMGISAVKPLLAMM